MKYNFNEIEAKWQKYWAENQTFKAENQSDKPKFYVLDMFPYPSGAGLHVGHPLGYIASDIYARYKRHKGFNVLHPMGYDSFGLPAEQYAIQTGQHPALTTEANISRYREQLDQIGFSFDWSREERTSDPSFYKWTQWIFIQLFNSWYDKGAEKSRPVSELVAIFETKGNAELVAACDDDTPGFTAEGWNAMNAEEQEQMLLKYRLTYLADAEVNWCPALGTVLANDEIVNGVSERGGHPVVRKKMTQWSMRISAFAERLLQGLEGLDWPEPLKDIQRNWIGKSVGAQVHFNIKDHEGQISVFTTRPDTIFGVSFMTLAPEHDLVKKITTNEQREAVEAYVAATAKRSERERMADVKNITGVFTGAYALHPFTGEEIPVWIGDYVLAGYGTGAVMAVPCGDQRDHDFARHFGLPIPNIFEGVDTTEEAFADKENTVIANSDFISGMPYKEASAAVIAALEEKGQGEGKINYRLRDAVFSRQRYWGEPFPVYYVNGLPKMIDPEHLPIALPEVEKYLPTETGEPPLGNAAVWAWDTTANTVVDNSLIDHKTVFPLELNTMPGWAGSSWYFNRYMDAGNADAFASQEALAYWKDVDLYIGGSEHATGHLLYSRFWQKFLFDLGHLPVDEYAKKLINQGMILGTSAFVYRLENSNTFVSKNLVGDRAVQAIHADVSMVNASDELDVEAFKLWRPEFADAEFEMEDGKYVVGREVEKMSKSKYNVVNPDDICQEYGADTLRMYEMFLGPLEQAKPWNTAGITGVHNFLKKLWKLYFGKEELIVTDEQPSAESLKSLHKTIKKVEEDIENFSFNTSVSTFMICVNELTAQKCHSRAILEPLAVLMSPYAPHIAEELWHKLGHDTSVAHAAFPVFEEKYLVESTKTYPISFNGKMRFTMELSLDLNKEEIEKVVMADERTQDQLGGRTPKKVIVVPGKIVNIVG
ncbi:leucine--tRNA ligase [Robertkochia sediminum]|uniref:leucine--tRNA ligase n=1 Tax=Robertkochia sediminum TaxID=2785326 RepID=UPI0019338C49|nr:leucine--tRNA ligase [Robertkochia sediminum]MBL7473830.1 leucine--tRNA ligase [Robertkochia sediminum]